MTETVSESPLLEFPGTTSVKVVTPETVRDLLSGRTPSRVPEGVTDSYTPPLSLTRGPGQDCDRREGGLSGTEGPRDGGWSSPSYDRICPTQIVSVPGPTDLREWDDVGRDEEKYRGTSYPLPRVDWKSPSPPSFRSTLRSVQDDLEP